MRTSGPRQHRGHHDGQPPAGLEPTGCRRPDEQIVEEARQCLELDGDVDATKIEVTCEHAIITLSGSVDSRQAKRRAEECVESVHGVQDVMNLLRVAALDLGGRSGEDERPSVWGDRGADAVERSEESRRRANHRSGTRHEPD